MTASQAVAEAQHVHAHAHDASPTPLWARVVTIDGVTLRRLGAAMLAIGALLAFSPIHPGLTCPLRATTGVPCPFCGMTTSVKACLRMDFTAAFLANPGGIAAVVSALVLVVWRPRSIKLPLVALVAAGVSMWVFQLFRFQVL